jgi:hypothetical protein
MKQQDLGLDLSTRRTRKQILLDEMDLGNSSVTTVLDGAGNQMLMPSRRS